jgi:23S rRNA pseudouridine2605 synthase
MDDFYSGISAKMEWSVCYHVHGVKKVERLQKIIAQAGVASRRKSEEYITSGRVKVNGETITSLGFKADSTADRIEVDGQAIAKEKPVYILFHKPKGVITSVDDPQGRKIVTDFIKGVKERVYPIGRLDYDTEGLLLLTNDGELANKLLHPSHEIVKTYWATVEGIPSEEDLNRLAVGILLEDGMTAPAQVYILEFRVEKNEAIIEIIIHEGRNRQVRRMCDAVGHPVKSLRRVKFGFLTLKGVSRGKFRHLKSDEVQRLKGK